MVADPSLSGVSQTQRLSGQDGRSATSNGSQGQVRHDLPPCSVPQPPITAQRYIRKLRGGAQAHLIEASDGHCYAVKFQNNPQHRRILINEWIAGALLRYLNIATPCQAILSFEEAFLNASPDVYIQAGQRRRAIEPGPHLGSRYPGNPDTLAVYDFLPDAVLHKVENLSDFMGMMVFDQWTANADSRQSIFFRAKVSEWVSTAHPLRVGFITLMIDHGFIFNGPHWEFHNGSCQGLYFQPAVYAGVCGWQQFEPWLERISQIPLSVFDDAVREIPDFWMESDGVALALILERLYRRRTQVADLLSECRRRKPEFFPAWA